MKETCLDVYDCVNALSVSLAKLSLIESYPDSKDPSRSKAHQEAVSLRLSADLLGSLEEKMQEMGSALLKRHANQQPDKELTCEAQNMAVCVQNSAEVLLELGTKFQANSCEAVVKEKIIYRQVSQKLANPGDHLMLTYGNSSLHYMVGCMTQFVLQGLAKSALVRLMVNPMGRFLQVLQMLSDRGIDTKTLVEQHRLEGLSYENSSRKSRIEYLRSSVKEAEERGFSSMYVWGEIPSLSASSTASPAEVCDWETEFLEYEKRVSPAISNLPLAACCGYNRDIHSRDFLDHVHACHPIAFKPQ